MLSLFQLYYGFSNPINISNTDMKVYGYAEDMIAVGGMFTGGFDDPSSFIIVKLIVLKI